MNPDRIGVMRTLALISLLLSIASCGLAERPNILLITCDNLGYGDLKMYRPESSAVTPRLDQLAGEGARLTQFYTAAPTCTVSRASLLTGRIPQRHGLLDQLSGVEGNYGVGLNKGEILISGMLKSAPHPYRTGCFGKWNIGFAEGSRPTERGFDHFFGHASGNIDYYHHRYSGKRDLFEGTEAIIRDGEYATDLFADAAIKFIEREGKGKHPWFCYLPFNAPHFPNKRNKLPGEPVNYQAPDRAFLALQLTPDEADPKRRYDAAVYALDEAIGRVLDAVDGSAQRDNTFVFFMSDNGAFRLNREGVDVGINEPLRSGGVTCWEGGLRVPALARWPGKIGAGSVVDAPLWSPDLFVACAELAEVTLPEGVDYDGKDPLPALTSSSPTPHESFYFSYRRHSALRAGDWKVVRENPQKKWMLFDLESDRGETKDRALSQPETVTRLARKFQEWETKTRAEK